MFAKPLISMSTLGAKAAPVANFSALSYALPSNVQIMTLQALAPGELLLRLSHQFGISDDATLSKPVTVDLASLFAPTAIHVTSAKEVSLTNNQDKSSILARRRAAASWRTEGSAEAPHSWRDADFDFAKDSRVMLGPLEIKTFVVTHKL